MYLKNAVDLYIGNFCGKEWQQELFTIKLLIILIVVYELAIWS